MNQLRDEGVVVGVHASGAHEFSKQPRESIRVVAGLGVVGDAHAGALVAHRSRVAADPTQPNLRQVHLIDGELHDELAAHGFAVGAGALGENITTRGVDLLSLPVGASLRIGTDALLVVTGLRNPCVQIDRFRNGLLSAVIKLDATGRLVGKAGIMSIVVQNGEVRPGDPIVVALPPLPHRRLDRV